MKSLWSELGFAGRALIVLLALVVVATPIAASLLVQRTHAAGRDSPLDWVSAGHRTAWAEATMAAEELETRLAAPMALAAPTLVKAAPLATMQGGAGSLKRGTPTSAPTPAQPTTPTPAGTLAPPTPPRPR